MKINSDYKLPAWVKEYVIAWRSDLNLDQWTINLSRSTDHPHAMGQTTLYPEISYAEITLRDDVTEDREEQWERTIIHELVHIRLAEATEFVNQEIVPELGGGTGRMAEAAFRRALEPAVECLALTLWRLSRDTVGDA